MIEQEKYYWCHDESGSCGYVKTEDDLWSLVDSDPLVEPISECQYEERLEQGFDSYE